MTRPSRPEWLRQRLRRRLLGMLACGAAAITGCSTGLEVRHLATGRVDTEAFELRGTDLDQLRREAQRRCPQGAEVLRQAVRDQRPTSTGDEGRIERWMSRAAAWVDPPQREAQLVLVCKPSALGSILAPAPAAQPASAALAVAALAPDAVAEGPPPVGPISPEW